MVRNSRRKIFPTDYRWRLRVERYASAVEAMGSRWHIARFVAPQILFLRAAWARRINSNTLVVLAVIKINMLFEKGQTLI